MKAQSEDFFAVAQGVLERMRVQTRGYLTWMDGTKRCP